MSTILEKIAQYKKLEVADAKLQLSASSADRFARQQSPARGFSDALRHKIAGGDWGLIAEVKKASPSKGLIRTDFDPVQIAQAYQAGGAACLSVLTDGPSFLGSSEFLVAARNACLLPVLRKDFMIDVYQIAESRMWGADCILLILAMIDDQLALDLETAAFEYGMDVLIEVHDRQELDRALKLRSPLIGINNRNLHTFETKLETTEELATAIPADRLVVAESGLSIATDLWRLQHHGVHAFLVGESLMRQHDVELATRQLLSKPMVVS
jgi:indole-3-glycerol phosphate synthase